MVTLEINLEVNDDGFIAHSINPVGSYGKAKTRSEAIDSILKDTRMYCNWLNTFIENSSYKLIVKDILTNISNVDIKEEIEGSKESILFKTEKKNITVENFEFLITVFQKLPEELLRIIFNYSNAEIEQEIIPKQPSIIDLLKNLYREEIVIIETINEDMKDQFYKSIDMSFDEVESLTILERLVKVQLGIIQTLRVSYDKLGKSVIEFKNANNQTYNWSYSKILRILIENKREKLNKIRELVEILEENKESLANGL